MSTQKEYIATTAQDVNNGGAPVTGETAGILGVGVSMVVGAILYLRRKTSRDGLEIFKDRTEGAMMKTIIEERDKAIAEAREAWAIVNANAREMGELTAENSYMKRELAEAREYITSIRRGVQDVGVKVDAMKSGLEKVEKKVGDSGFPPLGKN